MIATDILIIETGATVKRSCQKIFPQSPVAIKGSRVPILLPNYHIKMRYKLLISDISVILRQQRRRENF